MPFHDGDLRGYAAVSLAAVRDRVPGSVLDGLLAGLGKVPSAAWRLGNVTEVLRTLRLPASVEELWTYAGL
ncbi:hypothetical protein [Actinophytocola sp. KF-1]